MWEIEVNGGRHRIYCSQFVFPLIFFKKILVGFEFLFNYSCPLTALDLNVEWGRDWQKRLLVVYP